MCLVSIAERMMGLQGLLRDFDSSTVGVRMQSFLRGILFWMVSCAVNCCGYTFRGVSSRGASFRTSGSCFHARVWGQACSAISSPAPGIVEIVHTLLASSQLPGPSQEHKPLESCSCLPLMAQHEGSISLASPLLGAAALGPLEETASSWLQGTNHGCMRGLCLLFILPTLA